MTRYTTPNLPHSEASESNRFSIPDPWTINNTTTQTILPPPHPLDISHEIAAAHEPTGYISPEGNPMAVQIPEHTSEPSPSPFMTLLQDELKVRVRDINHLWDNLQDALALLYWLNTDGGAIG